MDIDDLKEILERLVDTNREDHKELFDILKGKGVEVGYVAKVNTLESQIKSAQFKLKEHDKVITEIKFMKKVFYFLTTTNIGAIAVSIFINYIK